eukprot:CAMPEP_0168558436 /NCGR_PEP_ID=MMETSP0413-20121227/9973_1 /TAXON_ID=136452 /ORGANISM="Filamoeba nolandi, Strain NC-AS-23-1" /LENGTH=467 /DNA_ID=CAMNT_0008589565 /DNA_START=92 /DNA_END=1495 /DNA_ORIENTATION=-
MKSGEITLTTHEDNVRQWEEKTLNQTIPWEGYHRANLILGNELELIKVYDKKSVEARVALFQKEGSIYAQLLLNLLKEINKEETLQYLLTLIDQILREYPESINIFLQLSQENSTLPFEPLTKLLARGNWENWYTYSKLSSVLALLLQKSSNPPEESVKVFCQWAREQLRKGASTVPSSPSSSGANPNAVSSQPSAADDASVSNAVSALQKFLLRDSFRPYVAAEDGLDLLASLLKTRAKNVQLTYQVLNCLWLMSYDSSVAQATSQTKLIPNLVEVMRNSQKEKTIRMSVATLRNLLDFGENNDQMIMYGITKPLESLSAKNWGDEDIVADLQTLKEKLEKNIALLSSWDVYKQEIISGALTWSTAHRSEKFWRENVLKFEEENHKLLLVLKELLNTSTSPLVLAVACFDLGEFARFHPRGKVIIQQLGLKVPLMKLMESKDAEVKKNALLAIQKIMVTNWEYLSM